MVEAGAKEVTEEQVVEALEAGARRDQADRRRPSTTLAKDAGKTKLPGRGEGRSTPSFYREVEAKVLGPLTEAMRIQRQARELRARVDQVLDELLASLPEAEAAAQGRRQGASSRS